MINVKKIRDLKNNFLDIGFTNKIKSLESRIIASAKVGKEYLDVENTEIYFSGDSKQNNNIIQKLCEEGFVVVVIGKDNKEYGRWQEGCQKVVVYW